MEVSLLSMGMRGRAHSCLVIRFEILVIKEIWHTRTMRKFSKRSGKELAGSHRFYLLQDLMLFFILFNIYILIILR